MSNLKDDPAKFFKLTHFAIEHAINSVFWIDADANILHANENAVNTFGYSLSELDNMKLTDLSTVQDNLHWNSVWEKVRSKRLFVIEGTNKTKFGIELEVACTFNFIEFDGKEYSCTFIQDITKRRIAEAELKRADEELKKRAASVIVEGEQKFYKMFEHSNDAILIIDPESEEILEANSQAGKMLGYSRIELLSILISAIHPDEITKLKEFTTYVINNNKGWTDELSCLTKHGNLLPAEISASVLELDGRKCILALVRDITERKKAELALKEVNEKLEKRVEERTRELWETNISLKNALQEVEKLKNQLQAENVYLQEEIKIEHNFDEIVTNSKVLKDLLRKVEQVAATDATVLILGETGTGKELFARAVHSISKRKDRVLVKVNCAALPANLIESELFGHEKGAFTGAIARKIGRFELADSGTIFLDEIGDLPLELQAKLLRVLQEGEFERLGNSNTIKVDVRIIAATNRSLEEAIEKGTFREDLYYRLYVFPLKVPSLKERIDDIPILTKHFVKKLSLKLGKPINKIPKNVINTLSNYNWPGNVRELENIIERSVILSSGDILELLELPQLKKQSNRIGDVGINDSSIKLMDIERDHIKKVLKECNWIIEGRRGASIKLGLPPTTLRDRMKKLNIKKPVNY